MTAILDFDEYLDAPIWGAEAIGREAHLFKKDGTVDVRKSYYLLDHGHLAAGKVGETWVSTRRQIRSLVATAFEQALKRREAKEQERREKELRNEAVAQRRVRKSRA